MNRFTVNCKLDPNGFYANKRLKITEKDEQNRVMEYLAYHADAMIWMQNTTGVYDPIKKIFRKAQSKYFKVGMPDIGGLWKRRGIVIEMKRPKTLMQRPGSPTQDQVNFLNEYADKGGISILAWTLQDVIEELKKYA